MPTFDDGPPVIDAANCARGQTNAEYATVLLRICGVKEEWTQPELGVWVSSIPEIRKDLEAVIQEIKRRTVENVEWHLRGENAVKSFRRFIEQEKSRPD